MENRLIFLYCLYWEPRDEGD